MKETQPCPWCDGDCILSQVIVHGKEYEGYKCEKCGETLATSQQMENMLLGHGREVCPAKLLMMAGEARRLVQNLTEALDEIDTSKHNENWYSEDEKQNDFLWDLRGFLMRADEEMNEIYRLLNGG